MNRTHVAAIISTTLLALLVPALSLAQDTGTPTPGYCPHISQNLKRGDKDVTTVPQGQVTELQKFLSDHFDLNPDTYVTGYFGNLTQQNVIRFQNEQGITPAAGFVGPLTREWSGGGADYAEYVTPRPGTAPHDYPKGSLICLVTSDPDTYGMCDGANDKDVVGIISTAPAVIGNSPALASSSPQRETDHILLSMLGRVPLRINLEGGPIKIGDRLAASSAAGVAMKATATARTIGIALDNFDTSATTTQIMIYIEPELTFADMQISAIGELTGFGSTSTPDVVAGTFMDHFLHNLFAKITTWLGDAGNGIDKIFANEIDAKNVYADIGTFKTTNTQKLCIGQTCVTEDQLKAMLAASAAAGTPILVGTHEAPATIPVTAASATSGPPILTINGDNPATLTVGSTYADLGAIITGPQADLNLGIHLYVDGAPTDAVQLDTSIAATHAIDYVVTGHSGLTSTTTRTVIVSAPANDNQASSTPPAANDNQASTTDASSTALND